MERPSMSLFEENTGLVYAIYNNRIAKSNELPSIREDLIQIGMFTLWKCCRSYDESKGNKFSTYACASIYRAMISHLAYEHRHTDNTVSMGSVVCTSEDGDELYLLDTISSQEQPQDSVESSDCLERVLAKLSEKQKETLCLLLQGYSQIEIARKFGVTKTAVHNIVNRIRVVFHSVFDGEG